MPLQKGAHLDEGAGGAGERNMIIAFERWPVTGQRVWRFRSRKGELFILAPDCYGLLPWQVHGWPGELEEEFDFATRREAVRFVLTLLGNPFSLSITFDGPCPFLTCFKTEPHTHPICPACGAVRYGNLYCEECRSHWGDRLEEIKEELRGAECKEDD